MMRKAITFTFLASAVIFSVGMILIMRNWFPAPSLDNVKPVIALLTDCWIA